MLLRYVVVIVLCITLLPGGETALKSGRCRHIVVCIMTRARESNLYPRKRRNKTPKLREQNDSKRRGRLFGILSTY
jgi:hypothetical protein